MAPLSRREDERYPAIPRRHDGFLTLRDEMNRMFDDFSRGLSTEGTQWPTARPLREFVPPVDVTDTDGEARVSVELPGLTERDVEVELEEDVLTVRGEKKIEGEESAEGRTWRETSSGSFVRRIQLPSDVKADGARATAANGVLRVTIPKAETCRTRRRTLEVRAG